MSNQHTIHISIKMLGKRRAIMEKVPLSLSENFHQNPTLKHFLELVVTQQVTIFNKKTNSKNWLNYLSPTEISERANHGKVAFGALHNPEKADLQKAIGTAIQAFEDGIFLVLIDGKKMEDLVERISFKENSEVIFIRLVALSGGYF